MSARWWTHDDEDEAARELVSTAQELQRLQMVRLQNAWLHYRLYAGLSPQSLVGFAVLGYVDPAPVAELLVPRFPLNIIKSTVDTVGSQLAEQDIKASFLTEGGSYDQRRKAQLLEQFTDGCFYLSDWYALAPKLLTDACVYGTAVARISFHGGKPCADRVFPYELLIDDLDAREGKPTQLIHRRIVQRDRLAALYPKAADAIEAAESTRLRVLTSTMQADMVEVYEAWHLPSGPDAKDGRRVVAIEGAALAVEDWTRDDFPFVFLRGTSGHAQMGFWGTGMAEVLGSLQSLVNDNVVALQEATSAATFKWAVEKGSQLARAQLNNRIGGVMEYVGKPPTPMETPDVARQFIEFVEWAARQAYQLVGVSQMAAQSMKPAGLDSGAALREFADVQTQRFALLSKAYARMHVDAAVQFIRSARDSDAEGGITVNSPGQKFLKKIRWSDINLDDDAYVCQPWPTNLLPKTPAARIQFTQELLRAQMITPAQGLKLLRFPDVAEVLGQETAAEEYASWLLCELIDEQEWVAPDPLTPLPLIADKVKKAYVQSLTEMEEDDPRLDHVRNWLVSADALLTPPAPPPGLPGAGPTPPPGPGEPEPPQGAPQGRPMPLPVSEMLPQGA